MPSSWYLLSLSTHLRFFYVFLSWSFHFNTGWYSIVKCVCVFCPPVFCFHIWTVKNTHSIPQNFLSALIYSRKLMLVMVSLGTQNLQRHTSLNIFQQISKELAFTAIFQNAYRFTRPPWPAGSLMWCPSQIFRFWQSKVELCLQDTMQCISWGLPPTVVILPFLYSLDFYLLLNFHNILFTCK